MTTRNLHMSLAVAGSLMLADLAPAVAQNMPAPRQQVDAYYRMCIKSSDMPKPYGEWDLLGHARLPKYCQCFSPLFAARAMKAARFMQQNPGKEPPGSLAEINREELAMRNICRKKTGLPAAKAPY